jgi:hypothetical protein
MKLKKLKLKKITIVTFLFNYDPDTETCVTDCHDCEGDTYDFGDH